MDTSSGDLQQQPGENPLSREEEEFLDIHPYNRSKIRDAAPEKLSETILSFETQLQIKNGTCSTCQNVFDHWQAKPYPQTTIFPHYSNLHFLESSSKRGCRLCRLFLQSFDNRDNLDVVEERKSLGISKASAKATQLAIVIESRNQSPGLEDRLQDSWNVCLDVPSISQADDSKHPRSSSEFNAVVSARLAEDPFPFKANNGSYSDPEAGITARYNNTLALAQSWLNTCLNTHGECTAANERIKTMPTRLLFIGEGQIALWQRPSNFCKRLKYATLSHCWGSQPILRLLKHNLSNFADQIPDSALCKTFQDAIYVARYLKIDYIWIDSLCIIQDDEEDWKKESVLMSDVYGGSYLNIAAAGANNGTQGCFFPPQQTMVFRHQVSAKINGKHHALDLAEMSL